MLILEIISFPLISQNSPRKYSLERPQRWPTFKFCWALLFNFFKQPKDQTALKHLSKLVQWPAFTGSLSLIKLKTPWVKNEMQKCKSFRITLDLCAERNRADQQCSSSKFVIRNQSTKVTVQLPTNLTSLKSQGVLVVFFQVTVVRGLLLLEDNL